MENRRRQARHSLERDVALHLGPRSIRARVHDVGRGGVRFSSPSLAIAADVLLHVYLARGDRGRVCAYGQVVRIDAHGIAIAFERVEPDALPLLDDPPSWQRFPPTDLYVSPSVTPQGRRWWGPPDLSRVKTPLPDG